MDVRTAKLADFGLHKRARVNTLTGTLTAPPTRPLEALVAMQVDGSVRGAGAGGSVRGGGGSGLSASASTHAYPSYEDER